MSLMYGPFGYLVQFANGTGGFFGYGAGLSAVKPGAKLSRIHHDGFFTSGRKAGDSLI
jgi:hypothetical protein